MSPWRIFAAVAVFLAITVLTFGGSAVGLALLYAWGDTGKYSGRADGVVYTKKGVRRSFVSPSNPQSAFQTNVRNFFGSFSSLWRSLTPSQQAGWRNLVLNGTNRLGKTTTYRGKQVYTRLNQFLSFIGASNIDDAPALAGIVSPETTGAVIDVSAQEIDMNLSNTDVSMGVIYYASMPLLAGRTTSRAKMIYAVADSSTLSPTDAWDGYVNAWGYTPVAGDNILVWAQYVDKVTGQPSADGSRGIVNVQA